MSPIGGTTIPLLETEAQRMNKRITEFQQL